MKRTVYIILAVLFIATLIAGCDQVKTKLPIDAELNELLDGAVPTETPENCDSFEGVLWGAAVDELPEETIEVIRRGVQVAGYRGDAYYTYDKDGGLIRGVYIFNESRSLPWTEALKEFLAIRNGLESEYGAPGESGGNVGAPSSLEELIEAGGGSWSAVWNDLKSSDGRRVAASLTIEWHGEIWLAFHCIDKVPRPEEQDDAMAQDERIDYPKEVTAPNEIDRYEADLTGLEIVQYNTGGMLREKTPVFTGNYLNTDTDIRDLLDMSQFDEDTLPVYKVVDSLRTDGMGDSDYESIMKRLKQEWYDFFAGTGVAEDKTVKQNEANPDNREHPSYLRSGSDDRIYNSAITVFTFSTLLEDTADTTEQNILAKAENNIFFKKAAEYLGITKPTVLSRVSHPLVSNEDGDTDKHFTIYQASDDIVETMYNIAFKSIRLSSYRGLPYSGNVTKASSIEYVGDCRVRSYEDAVSEAVSVYGIPEEDIFAYDIGYYNDKTPGYYVPCYRFIVNTHGQYYFQVPDAPEPENLACIDIIVPAVVLG